jgi:hypothetical protein
VKARLTRLRGGSCAGAHCYHGDRTSVNATDNVNCCLTATKLGSEDIALNAITFCASVRFASPMARSAMDTCLVGHPHCNIGTCLLPGCCDPVACSH